MSVVWLGTFVATVLVVIVAMLALASGLMLGRGAPRGSCGVDRCQCRPGAQTCEVRRQRP